MSPLIVSLAWCWVQVMLVAAVAIGLSLLALRRSPTAGATIAWSGVVAALVLSGLVVVPLPARLVRTTFGNLFSRPLQAARTIDLSAQVRSPAGPGNAHDTGLLAAFDSSLIANLLKSLGNSESAVMRHRSEGRWVLVVVAVGSLIGLLRLIGGLASIATLRRRSNAVADQRVKVLLEELWPSLPLRHLPQVCESVDLESAAVVGWSQPVVVLPRGWRDWSPAELKAVLAHELAHLARHDASWRLIAAFTVALHWGHPLVHWLRRQLLLAQELAADEMAAAAIGSKRKYLQALAELALRQDSPAAVTPHAALLPVFSGFLLRRIEMLRAKDGSTCRDWRLLTQGTAVGLVVSVTLFAAAIRGLAEPPESESDGSIRVAKATDVKPRPDVAAANQAAEAGMFQRPAFDVAKMAFGKQGGFLLRLGEILGQARFAKAAREVDEWFSKYWKDSFPGAEAPPCSLKDIEYVAGDFSLWARYVVPKDEESNPHSHELLGGSQCGYIRWQKPVDEIFAWFRRTPGAEQKWHGDFAYIELFIPVLGPTKTCICRLDDRTLLWSGGESVLLKRLDQLAVANDPPAWHKAWKEVEGGLVTAVAAESEYKNAPKTIDDESERLTQDFFAKTRFKAIGADWQPNEQGIVSFKLQLGFDNESDAHSIEADIQRAIAMYVQEVRENASKADDEKKKSTASALISILQQAGIKTRQVENGWQIDLNLSGPIDVESSL